MRQKESILSTVSGFTLSFCESPRARPVPSQQSVSLGQDDCRDSLHSSGICNLQEQHQSGSVQRGEAACGRKTCRPTAANACGGA